MSVHPVVDSPIGANVRFIHHEPGSQHGPLPYVLLARKRRRKRRKRGEGREGRGWKGNTYMAVKGGAGSAPPNGTLMGPNWS